MIKVSLSSIIEVISGGTPKTKVPEYWNGNIGWLSVTDFNNDLRFVYDTEKKITEKGVKESNTKFLNRGDIIISARGTVGALAQIGKPMCFNQSCFGIRGKENMADTDFLYYSLKNYVKNIVKRSQGSVFDTINLNSFDLMEIEIPKSIITQKQIAKVLSDLDAKIEINNKINQELEAMAKTLYDYWFVQFDFPDKNGIPYKSSGGNMVFDGALKREIPEGWEVENLLHIANFQNGLACQKYRPINDDFLRVIKIKDMKEGFSEKTEKVRSDVPDKIKIFNGDILFSWSASLEVIQWSGGEGALNQHIFKVTSEKYPKSYYYFELLNYLQHFKMQAELRKTTMGHITQEHLKQSRIAILPIDLINKLDEIIKPILNKQVKLDEENQKLSELRDWLLPMLMNGQVTVGYAEKEVEGLGLVAEGGEE
jgi:type I restriction enzyme S subunit